MAAQTGDSLLIKLGDGGGTEVFTTIGGGTTTGMTLNNEMVDVSTAGGTKWRELLEAAGIQSLTLSLSGIFKETASEKDVRAIAFANTHNNYQFVDSEGSTVTGSFQITSLEYAGEHNGERTYDITFESAGDLTESFV